MLMKHSFVLVVKRPAKVREIQRNSEKTKKKVFIPQFQCLQGFRFIKQLAHCYHKRRRTLLDDCRSSVEHCIQSNLLKCFHSIPSQYGVLILNILLFRLLILLLFSTLMESVCYCSLLMKSSATNNIRWLSIPLMRNGNLQFKSINFRSRGLQRLHILP